MQMDALSVTSFLHMVVVVVGKADNISAEPKRW